MGNKSEAAGVVVMYRCVRGCVPACMRVCVFVHMYVC